MMNIEKVLEGSGFSPEQKRRASEIFKQLDGLKISEAAMILTFCEKVLDQCVITVGPVFIPETADGPCFGGKNVESTASL